MCNDVEGFRAWDESMHDRSAGFLSSVRDWMVKMGGNSPYELFRNILNSVAHKSVWQEYNMSGTKSQAKLYSLNEKPPRKKFADTHLCNLVFDTLQIEMADLSDKKYKSYTGTREEYKKFMQTFFKNVLELKGNEAHQRREERESAKKRSQVKEAIQDALDEAVQKVRKTDKEEATKKKDQTSRKCVEDFQAKKKRQNEKNRSLNETKNTQKKSVKSTNSNNNIPIQKPNDTHSKSTDAKEDPPKSTDAGEVPSSSIHAGEVPSNPTDAQQLRSKSPDAKQVQSKSTDVEEKEGQNNETA
jgi:hypothetical protein